MKNGLTTIDNKEIIALRRKTHFGYQEHPCLSKLSEQQYQELRENEFFIVLLGGPYDITGDEQDDYLDDLVRKNINHPTIDWENIKKYYVERYIEESSRKIPVTTRFDPIVEREKWLIEMRVKDIRQVLNVIDKYENSIQNDTFCLY